MSFLKNLFGSKNNKKENNNAVIQGEVPTEKKLGYKVYPRIKNQQVHSLEVIYNERLGGDLVLTFVQDIDDRIVYVLKKEVEVLRPLIDEWKNNIVEVPFEIFSNDHWGDKLFFNEAGDYSNEKIFDIHFVNHVCERLKTDKLIFSISRRHRMQMISYYEEFKELEMFFYKHFDTWSTSDLDDEHITEYVLIGEKDKGIVNIVHLGFRLKAYTKDGEYLLSYSTVEDDVIGNRIDFQEIIEKRKEAFTY